MKSFSVFFKLIILIIAVSLLMSCSDKVIPDTQNSVELEKLTEPVPQTEFSLRPINKLSAIPVYDSKNFDAFQVDLRFADMSDIDLRDSTESLLHSIFSTSTIWPEMLPDGFDPKLIMEYGKDPGLGLRELHKQGYTGKGVSIAIIDQQLGTTHKEYSDRLAYYEDFTNEPYAAMHGCAVASLAVGQNVGVAPDATLYFFSPSWMDEENNLTFLGIAEAIDRIVEINLSLGENERIRSVSIARGIRGEQNVNGYNEVMAAIDRAEQDGIFIITTSMDSIGFNFLGLSRDPRTNPNDLEGYSYPYWWSEDTPDSIKSNLDNRIGFPMGSRTYAGWTGSDVYEFGVPGGFSWTVPYINGLYAIAVQVKPDIIPREFWDILTETSQKTTTDCMGEEIELTIANPTAFVEAIEAKVK